MSVVEEDEEDEGEKVVRFVCLLKVLVMCTSFVRYPFVCISIAQ